MLDALRVGVVRMHLHREPVVSGDDLRKHGEDTLGVEIAQELGAEPAPQIRDR